ncbi:MAG TPA: hypothetical protein VHX38_18790 [Pseudonocardiaceae bacterium]|jgi:hypothetical protein|nr:hypothetical protein [Pseudonocardiaceae bacterium]
MSTGAERLAGVLAQIVEHDTDYDVRYPLVFEALALALDLDMRAGIRIDPSEPDWPVVYIELPTGQVSWHLPQHGREWDQHSTDEKHQRIEQFVNQVQAETPSAPAGARPVDVAGLTDCPNTPPCEHPALVHDNDELNQPRPICWAVGCTCGRTESTKDGEPV